jgi:N-acetylglucosamine kinase-like BadF-type ATPase
MPPIVLGLDGGGSHTVAVLLDGRGRDLARGVSGPSNHQSVGVEAAQQAVRAAITAALDTAGHPRLSAACWGMAGLDRPEDERILAEMARSVLPELPVDIVHDTRNALVAGTEGKLYGVVIIAGTGSSIVGYAPDGRTARAGGWGHLLGDEGSGYDLARQGLNAATKARDHRGPATTLVERLPAIVGLETLEALADRLYLEDWSAPKIASLAPAVLSAAEEGDPAAAQIVDQGADELALAAETVVDALGLMDQVFDVVLSGGIFQGSPRMVARLRGEIARFAPGATVSLPRREPAWGSAWIALQSTLQQTSPLA